MEAKTRPDLSWTELVTRTAAAAGTPRAEAERVLRAFVGEAQGALLRMGTVRLKGIGALTAEWRQGRVLRSPKDQRRMFVDGRFHLRLRPAEAMKRELSQLSPQLWKDQEHQAAWRLAETLLSDLELYHANKVPEVAPTSTDEEVLAQCEAAFGHQWRRVMGTWTSSVSERVRQARDHLIQRARVRWGR